MLGPIEDEVKDDEQVLSIGYDFGGASGRVTRRILARPVNAVHISDERDGSGKRTERTPDIDSAGEYLRRGKEIFRWSE